MTDLPIPSRANAPRRRAGFRAAGSAALLLPLALVSASFANAATDQGVTGLWRTPDGKGVVRIAPCGAQLCGHLAEVLDRGPEVPKTDINNPDARARKAPLVGLRTLWGLSRKGSEWKGGHAYDPKSGKTYRASLALNRDGSLKVLGCVLFICQSQRWTRAG